MSDAANCTVTSSLPGRGAWLNPPNRFEGVCCEDDFDHAADDDRLRILKPATEYLPDASQTIVSENDSPDVGFRYSVNPYRGCEHGCAYCYARPTHEFLGFSAGLDFEARVVVKHRAPALLREWLMRKAWQPETIVFSGVTDCYQPAERRLGLTRACLQVAHEFRQPVWIVTKNALVARDLDVLSPMAALGTAGVSLSVTTLDAELARTMEPRTSTPAARLRTLQRLSAAGVPAHVMVAPVIPGLNDSEIPAILRAAREAGATSASYVLLRLPQTVLPVFLEWLRRTQPLRRSRVERLIRETRGGGMNDSRFGSRMRGTGAIAEQIRQTFRVFARKYELDSKPASLDASRFERPPQRTGQLTLF